MVDLGKELERFYTASQIDQAWALNQLPLDIRHTVAKRLFKDSGWVGGITSKGMYVSSGVAGAMAAGVGPTNFTKYTGASGDQDQIKETM